jgi:hypothetical protein
MELVMWKQGLANLLFELGDKEAAMNILMNNVQDLKNSKVMSNAD